MEGDPKIVEFEKYCGNCKYEKVDQAEEPCNNCLYNPSAIDSHKPVYFEPKEE